jgi:sterol 3beta-glucosyltransferase
MADAFFEGAEAVLMHPFALHAMHHAEARRLPAILVSLIPVVPSRVQAPLFFPRAPAWGWLRSYVTNLSLEKIYQTVAHIHEPHRRALGLGPLGPNIIRTLRRRRIPCVQLYSAHVSPRPPDWEDDVHVTGFCFLPAPSDYVPERGLAQFLAGGEAPIYVGFGSMTGRDPEELAKTAIAAIRRARVRAVLCTGWGGLSRGIGGDDVFVVDDVPHDWLFPRVRSVLHHGGAGTLAAGLRAGRPTGIAAFFADQPFWGEMAARAGVGPRPLPKRSIDANRLGDMIERLVGDESYARAAERMQAALAREDGAGAAAEVIAGHLARASHTFWT